MQVRSAALALSVLLLPTVDARIDACDCIRPQALSPAIRKEAPFIFEGKVVEIVERNLHTLRTTSGGGSSEVKAMGREVVFDVTRAWNGVTTKRVEVSSEWSDCVYPFEIDRTYVVFAWKDAKGCGRDRHVRPGDASLPLTIARARLRAGETEGRSPSVRT
jgi:hypothetical protein